MKGVFGRLNEVNIVQIGEVASSKCLDYVILFERYLH